MRLVLSSLIVIAGLLSSQATAAAAPEQTASADIRDSGFVYCVSGQVNTFNPQKASSGLIVDTLAAQLYDRLLDVDPYTYRLVPELAESWEVLDNGATYRFHLRRDVSFQKTAWFTPTRKLNADDVVFTFQRIFDRRHPWHNINGSSFPYFDSLQFADNVKSVRKLDNNTVEFRLTQPDASFLWHLATHYASVMSAEYAAQLSRKPVFWLALLLTLFFSLTLGWLPVSGRFDLLYEVKPVTGFAIIDAWISDSPWRDEMVMSAIRHMVLPVLTLSVAPTTEVIRLMRISTIEVYDQNYVKAAATRGLSRFTILRRHVLHNALPPVIPRLGLQFSTMLTLAMITEMVFSWPGLGRWLIHAIRQQDYAAISAGVMVIGSLVIVVNVISDILGAMANHLKHKEWYALR